MLRVVIFVSLGSFSQVAQAYPIVRLSSNRYSLIALAESTPIFSELFEKVVKEVEKDVTIKVTNEYVPQCFG